MDVRKREDPPPLFPTNFIPGTNKSTNRSVQPDYNQASSNQPVKRDRTQTTTPVDTTIILSQVGCIKFEVLKRQTFNSCRYYVETKWSMLSTVPSQVENTNIFKCLLCGCLNFHDNCCRLIHWSVAFIASFFAFCFYSDVLHLTCLVNEET